DNIWTVDEGTNLVTKFSPQGKVLMVIGRRPPVIDGPVIAPAGPNPPAQKYILCRPSDVGFDPQGNIFISDGYCNNRVVKYHKIDCRNPNELILGEIESWRVQKYILQPAPARPSAGR